MTGYGNKHFSSLIKAEMASAPGVLVAQRSTTLSSGLPLRTSSSRASPSYMKP